MKQFLFNQIKNIYGWKTTRKIVVISVDDYGNVRLDSKKAREALNDAGVNKVYSRFDQFDSLETREDLEMLFEVLSSVTDANGRHAVFTPFALPCNINFEKMASENYEYYHYELLTETYTKLAQQQAKAYEGTWQLWQEGVAKKIMEPEFHGREHFNLKVFEEKLSQKDEELMNALRNRSLASIRNSGYNSIGWTAAFAFWDPIKDTHRFQEIIQSGLIAFDQVYGKQPTVFTPPAQQLPEFIESKLSKMGIVTLDKPFSQSKHLGYGKYKRKFNFMGYNSKNNLVEIVRNVIFEPTDNRGINWVDYSLKQIESAFFWNKPAIISSHRVNFCGHIDPNNRAIGLKALKVLLDAIVKKWPEVEFMSVKELSCIIENKNG